jgi:hypothetical protein
MINNGLGFFKTLDEYCILLQNETFNEREVMKVVKNLDSFEMIILFQDLMRKSLVNNTEQAKQFNKSINSNINNCPSLEELHKQFTKVLCIHNAFQRARTNINKK